MSHDLEIPSDDDVLAALLSLGGTGGASDIVRGLMAQGHDRAKCQLALQRAHERELLTRLRNWQFVVAEHAFA
jgi:hypothetical protein